MLSDIEAQNWATIEYLLAGLPVVTTPSIGGRDRWLTPDNSIIVPDTPTRVAAAATYAAKLGRDSRASIQAQARSQIASERRLFAGIVEEVLAAAGEKIETDTLILAHKAPSKGRPQAYFENFFGSPS
jgi:hypothetical protein